MCMPLKDVRSESLNSSVHWAMPAPHKSSSPLPHEGIKVSRVVRSILQVSLADCGSETEPGYICLLPFS